MLIVLLSFSEFFARGRAKCLSLNYKPCMGRPTLINLSHAEVKYYLFMMISDKCTGSFTVLSSKICFPKETKDVNVKAFNIIKNKNEAETMAKHISCDCKCKFNSKACNSNQK